MKLPQQLDSKSLLSSFRRSSTNSKTFLRAILKSTLITIADLMVLTADVTVLTVMALMVMVPMDMDLITALNTVDVEWASEALALPP